MNRFVAYGWSEWIHLIPPNISTFEEMKCGWGLRHTPSTSELLEHDLFVLPWCTLPASRFMLEYPDFTGFFTAILLFMLFPKLRTSLLTWSAWPMMRGARAESPPWIPKRLWFTNTKLYRFPSVSCSWAYTLFAGKGPILIIFISTRTLKCSKMLIALNWTPGKPEWRQGVLEFGMALYSTDAPLWEGLWWPLKAFFFF